MKKMFFMAAIAGVALASCAKNEVETPEQDIITFAEPVMAVQTKATEIIGNYPQSKHFSVFANYFTGNYTELADGTPYMQDVETAYSSAVNGWDPAAVTNGVNYYWPKQGTLTFAAYSPSSVEATYDQSGIHFTDFTVPASAAAQYDLLFSERSYNQSRETMKWESDPYKGTQIQFNHALSSIIFNAKTDKDYSKDNFYITIKQIQVQNIYSTATFNQNLSDSNGATTSATWEGWSDHKGETTYTAFEGSQRLTNENAIMDIDKISAGEASDIKDVYNSHLILLPQYLSGAKLYVKYTISNYNVDTDATAEGVQPAVISQDATIELATSKVDSWFRGKRYTYNITFGLDKIYFDPVVTEWVNVDGGSFTVGNTNQSN